MYQKLDSRDFILQNIDTKSPRVRKASKGMVLLIKAAWCPHCVQYIPEFETFSSQHSNYKFYVVEQTENNALLDSWKELVNPAFEVNGFPTVVLYDRDGTPINVVKNRFKLNEEL